MTTGKRDSMATHPKPRVALQSVLGRIRAVTNTRTQEMTSQSADDSIQCPVISYEEFVSRVKEIINPLLSRDIIRIAGNYLQDMGEVSYDALIGL